MTKQDVFFYIVFFLSVGLAVYLVWPLATVIIFAVIASMLAQPLYEKINATRLSEGISTALTLVIVGMGILIPLAIVLQITFEQLGTINSDINDIVSSNEVGIDNLIERVNGYLERTPYITYQIDKQAAVAYITDLVQPALDFVSKRAVAIGSASAQFVTRLILFFILIAALIPNFTRISQMTVRLSLLDIEDDRLYFKRFKAMALSMIRGSLVIAITQGSVAGIAMWIAGVPYVFFLTLICIVLSLVPLGAGVVLAPISLIFLLLGNIWQVVFLLAINFLVIANIDNILRPMLVSKDADLHPALLLLSVFGGLATFGFLGVIYGPIIMIMCVTSLEVYERRARRI